MTKTIWIFLLIAIWAGGSYFIYDSYFDIEKQSNAKVENKGYFPLKFTHQIFCENKDSIYFVEGDEINCFYHINADEEASFLPQIELTVNGDENLNILSNEFNFIDRRLNESVEIKNKLHRIDFKIYPPEEGTYRIKLNSKFFKPPLIYKDLSAQNNSIKIKINDNVENIARIDWFLNYADKEPLEYKDKFRHETIGIDLECHDWSHSWFTNELISCSANLKNEGSEPIHIIPSFNLIKGDKVVTFDEKIVELDEGMFEINNDVSFRTELSPSESDTRFARFIPKESGNYTLMLESKAVRTNLKQISTYEDSLTLQFKAISREEYIRKEENRRTIAITLLIALFFSTPLALNAIRELLK